MKSSEKLKLIGLRIFTNYQSDKLQFVDGLLIRQVDLMKSSKKLKAYRTPALRAAK